RRWERLASRSPGFGAGDPRRRRRDMGDVGLNTKPGVEELLVLFRLELTNASGRRQRDVDRRDDTWQRADIGEELRDLMVWAGEGHLVPIGVELVGVDDAVGRDIRRLEAGAACRG